MPPCSPAALTNDLTAFDPLRQSLTGDWSWTPRHCGYSAMMGLLDPSRTVLPGPCARS